MRRWTTSLTAVEPSSAVWLSRTSSKGCLCWPDTDSSMLPWQRSWRRYTRSHRRRLLRHSTRNRRTHYDNISHSRHERCIKGDSTHQHYTQHAIVQRFCMHS